MARTRTRATALIIQNNKILLIYRNKRGEQYWVFPGGGVEEGELPRQALVREVREETGLEVANCHEANLNISDDSMNGNNVFFWCRVKDGQITLGGPEAQADPSENQYYPQWVNLEKVKDLNLYPESVKNIILEKYEDR